MAVTTPKRTPITSWMSQDDVGENAAAQAFALKQLANRQAMSLGFLKPVDVGAMVRRGVIERYTGAPNLWKITDKGREEIGAPPARRYGGIKFT